MRVFYDASQTSAFSESPDPSSPDDQSWKSGLESNLWTEHQVGTPDSSSEDDISRVNSRQDSLIEDEVYPFPLPAPIPGDTRSSTEQHLIFLTRTFIGLLNLRVYTHPFYKKHLSPSMYTDYGSFGISGLQAFLNRYQRMVEKSPAFHTVLINESAVVDEWRGTGNVLVSKDMSAYLGAGRRMAGAIMFSWERTWEGWICKSGNIISGTPVFLA